MTIGKYKTIDEIKFICMMIDNKSQLTENSICARTSSINKLSSYKNAIQKRNKWDGLNKYVIEKSISIIEDKLKNGDLNFSYNTIYNKAVNSI